MKRAAKIWFFCALLATACAGLKAQISSETYTNAPAVTPVMQESNLSSVAGISLVPSNNWSTYKIDDDPKQLTYDFDATALTTYEGNVYFRKLGLNMGLNADVDNNFVGKLDRLAGYLGLGRVYLRVQSGKLRGTTHWSGYLGPGQTRDANFDNKYTNVDVLYHLKSASAMYIGMGYTAFSLPTQVRVLLTNSDKEHQVVGHTPLFDPNYDIKTYSFLFGMDTMAGPLVEGVSDEGFGPLLYTQDKAGIGFGTLSNETRVAAEAAYPGRKAVDGKMISGIVDYDATFGLQWVKSCKSAKLAIGAGYNIGGTMVLPFGGSADNPTEIGFDSSVILLHHGPAVRLFLSWL